MTLRKSRILFSGLFTVVVLLAIALVVFNSSEPTYHGRRLTHIFHKGLERNRGGSVRRLDLIEPNDDTPHRCFEDRL